MIIPDPLKYSRRNIYVDVKQNLIDPLYSVKEKYFIHYMKDIQIKIDNKLFPHKIFYTINQSVVFVLDILNNKLLYPHYLFIELKEIFNNTNNEYALLELFKKHIDNSPTTIYMEFSFLSNEIDLYGDNYIF